MIALISEGIPKGDFKNIYLGYYALEDFGKVGDFIEGRHEIFIKTEQGIIRKSKHKPLVQAGQKIILSTLV